MTDTQRLDLLIRALLNAGFVLPPELVPNSTGNAADGAAGGQA
jgi:hypothetical protein